VLWAPGTASALDAGNVASGRDIGAINAFSRRLDGQTLTFAFNGDQITDEETGSEWNVLGQAVSGPLAGSKLTSVVGINHFWLTSPVPKDIIPWRMPDWRKAPYGAFSALFQARTGGFILSQRGVKVSLAP
jgi:hypothetical protein